MDDEYLVHLLTLSNLQTALGEYGLEGTIELIERATYGNLTKIYQQAFEQLTGIHPNWRSK